MVVYYMHTPLPEAFMKRGRLSFSLVLCISLVVALMMEAGAIAKIPGGYRDVKLGMNKTQVLDLLEKNRTHYSYDDVGQEIREIVRGDDLFRYATYLFNGEGILVQIGLQMREILGRDKVLQLYNSQHGLNLTPQHSTVEADMSIEVKDNALVMKMLQSGDKRSAQRTK
jgi:hypothetical protein